MTHAIIAFLREIGIPVRLGELDGDTFLPGIEVRDGGLVVDEARLEHPGDLLHEAGHLAVVDAGTRRTLGGALEVEDLEMTAIEHAAIAWSYAAAVHLGIDPAAVFHEGGYRGRSAGLIATFGAGVYPGAHHLVARGMTQDLRGDRPYPLMQRWLA